jgi:alanine racemase
MAVVKANGYGHGAITVAKTLQGADGIGVASLEEALVLRERGGVTAPVCLLEGFFQLNELPLLVQHDLTTVVHTASQLEALENYKGDGTVDVWAKFDTGMHRLGFRTEDADAVIARLRACKVVDKLGIMSHFADADRADSKVTPAQIGQFNTLIAKFGLAGSIANSAGVLLWPASISDWVRPGLMLYGASPVADRSAEDLGLLPAMTIESALIAVNRQRRGDAVGYSGSWICPEDMPVGVVAFGYGDGYPRHAPPGTPVLVNGKRVPLIGRVSMDMITVDLRTQAGAKTGDPVVLWGRGLPADEIARHAGTISYELFCHVTERIPRITHGD